MEDKILIDFMGRVERNVGKLTESADNIEKHVGSVSKKADKIHTELTDHKSDLEAHGIKSENEGRKSVREWLSLGVAFLALVVAFALGF